MQITLNPAISLLKSFPKQISGTNAKISAKSYSLKSTFLRQKVANTWSGVYLTFSSFGRFVVCAWRISWTEEPGGLQFTGSQESDMTEGT